MKTLVLVLMVAVIGLGELSPAGAQGGATQKPAVKPTVKPKSGPAGPALRPKIKIRSGFPSERQTGESSEDDEEVHKAAKPLHYTKNRVKLRLRIEPSGVHVFKLRHPYHAPSCVPPKHGFDSIYCDEESREQRSLKPAQIKKV